VRLSQITGLPVVDTHVARQAGVVSDVLLDLATGRVAILNVKHGDGLLIQRIPVDFIHRIGPHTVMVADTVAVNVAPPRPEQGWFSTAALVGLEVLTEGGDRVGHIADAELDGETLSVTAYLLKGGTWNGPARRRVTPDEVLTFSAELMIVRERPSRRGR